MKIILCAMLAAISIGLVVTYASSSEVQEFFVEMSYDPFGWLVMLLFLDCMGVLWIFRKAIYPGGRVRLD